MSRDRVVDGTGELRGRMRQFAAEAIAPHSDAMDRQASLVPSVRAALFSEGVFALGVPEEYGGRYRDIERLATAVEEIARVDPGVAVAVHVHAVLASTAIARWGSPEVRADVLPGMATDRLAAFALSEEQAGSDAFALATVAKRIGDEFVLSGRKRWTSLAPQADVFVVFARLADPDDNPEQGKLAAFVIDRDTDGLLVGPPADQTCVRAAATAELTLTDVRVPIERMLAGPGITIAMETLTTGRIGIAAQQVGLAAGALQAVVEHTRSRKQFGRRLADFQAVQLSVGTMATDLEAAKALLYSVIGSFSQADPLTRLRNAAMVKQFAARVAGSVTSTAVDLYGGLGFLHGNPAERFHRDAKVGAVYEGTSTILLRTIASTVLGQVAGDG